MIDYLNISARADFSEFKRGAEDAIDFLKRSFSEINKVRIDYKNLLGQGGDQSFFNFLSRKLLTPANLLSAASYIVPLLAGIIGANFVQKQKTQTEIIGSSLSLGLSKSASSEIANQIVDAARISAVKYLSGRSEEIMSAGTRIFNYLTARGKSVNDALGITTSLFDRLSAIMRGKTREEASRMGDAFVKLLASLGVEELEDMILVLNGLATASYKSGASFDQIVDSVEPLASSLKLAGVPLDKITQSITSFGEILRASGGNLELATKLYQDFYNVLAKNDAGIRLSAITGSAEEFIKIIKEKGFGEAIKEFGERFVEATKNMNADVLRENFGATVDYVNRLNQVVKEFDVQKLQELIDSLEIGKRTPITVKGAFESLDEGLMIIITSLEKAADSFWDFMIKGLPKFIDSFWEFIFKELPKMIDKFWSWFFSPLTNVSSQASSIFSGGVSALSGAVGKIKEIGGGILSGAKSILNIGNVSVNNDVKINNPPNKVEGLNIDLNMKIKDSLNQIESKIDLKR